MRVRIRGRYYDLQFVPHADLENCRGDCDSPRVPGKRIRIADDLRGARLLDTLIHECLHAACWDLAEEAVDEFVTDVARILMRTETATLPPK